MNDLPFKGMTKRPFFEPLPYYPAFMGYVRFVCHSDTIGKQIINQFEQETGHPISKENFPKFLDWLVVNHWGEEGSQPSGEDEQ